VGEEGNTYPGRMKTFLGGLMKWGEVSSAEKEKSYEK